MFMQITLFQIDANTTSHNHIKQLPEVGSVKTSSELKKKQ
jgi:hypothetical protein